MGEMVQVDVRNHIKPEILASVEEAIKGQNVVDVISSLCFMIALAQDGNPISEQSVLSTVQVCFQLARDMNELRETEH